jgi:hypothetical protein
MALQRAPGHRGGDSLPNCPSDQRASLRTSLARRERGSMAFLFERTKPARREAIEGFAYWYSAPQRGSMALQRAPGHRGGERKAKEGKEKEREQTYYYSIF